MTTETTGDHRRAQPPGVLDRVVQALTAVEIAIAGVAALMIFVLVLVQAGQRYLPVDGWTWTGELARYGLVWLTFSAAGVLVTRDGHIALQVVDQIPYEPVVRAIHVVAMAVVAACGVGFAAACLALIDESGFLTTPALGIPMQWVYVLPLVGFVSTAVRAGIGAVLIALHGVQAADESGSLPVQVNGPRAEGQVRA